MALAKAKYVAWERAGADGTEPVYPFAAMLRFAVCERTNAQMDDEYHLVDADSDLLEANFVLSHNVMLALQSMLKFPMFGSRVLLSTPKLKELVLDVTYQKTKDIYTEMFRYPADHQERPELYASCKEKWRNNGNEIKAMLDIFHSAPHRLHREKTWIGLYQYHQQVLCLCTVRCCSIFGEFQKGVLRRICKEDF